MNITLSFRDEADPIVLLVTVGIALIILIGTIRHYYRRTSEAEQTVRDILYFDPTIARLSPSYSWDVETDDLNEAELRRLARVARHGERVLRDHNEVDEARRRLTEARK